MSFTCFVLCIFIYVCFQVSVIEHYFRNINSLILHEIIDVLWANDKMANKLQKKRLRPFSPCTLPINNVHLLLDLVTLEFAPLTSGKRFVQVLLACGCLLICSCSFSFLGFSTRTGHLRGKTRRCLRCSSWRRLLFSLLQRYTLGFTCAPNSLNWF